MTKGLSIREYARRRRAAGLKGGTPSSVHKAITSGRIRRDENGLIDPERADADWAAASVDAPGVAPARPSQGDPREPARHAAPNTSSPAVLPPGAPSYATSRAVREAYSARLTKLNYEERSKTLVDAARVHAEAFRCARNVRDALLAIPGRLAAILAAETDPVVVEARLNEELRSVLEVLADG